MNVMLTGRCTRPQTGVKEYTFYDAIANAAVRVTCFDFRNPATVGTSMAERYEAALEMAERPTGWVA